MTTAIGKWKRADRLDVLTCLPVLDLFLSEQDGPIGSIFMPMGYVVLLFSKSVFGSREALIGPIVEADKLRTIS